MAFDLNEAVARANSVLAATDNLPDAPWGHVDFQGGVGDLGSYEPDEPAIVFQGDGWTGGNSIVLYAGVDQVPSEANQICAWAARMRSDGPALADDVLSLAGRLESLWRAIRHCRDQRGDDRCWKDWEDVYRELPEGYTPPERDEAVELDMCRAFIRSCHDPSVKYVSPEIRIRQLEQALVEIILATEGPADYAPELVGKPDRYERLVDMIGDVARGAMSKEGR